MENDKENDKKKEIGKGKSKNDVNLEPTLDETVLTVAQRMKRKQLMKKLMPKILRGKAKKAKKRADAETIKKRATLQAKNILRKKLSGGKDVSYADMSIGEKQALDKKMEKKQSAIQKLVKKLVPQVKKQERERFAKKGKKEEFDMNESFELFFEGDTHLLDMFDEMMGEDFVADMDGVIDIEVESILEDIKGMSTSELLEMDTDKWGIKRLSALTTKKKKYEVALKMLNAMIDKLSDDEKKKHGTEWFAAKIASQIDGIDTKLLAKKYESN